MRNRHGAYGSKRQQRTMPDIDVCLHVWEVEKIVFTVSCDGPLETIYYACALCSARGIGPADGHVAVLTEGR